MDYDKMTIKSLARDCSRDSFYKINAADLESRIQYLCDKYHQDKLNNLPQHLVMLSKEKLEEEYLRGFNEGGLAAADDILGSI